MRGGKRKNAGRKKLDKKTIGKTYCLYAEQHEFIKTKGGSKYLRKIIELLKKS